MPTNSIAVCMGLNGVDPAHYNGWPGKLNACEADAKTMMSIAESAGFQHIVPLLTAAATRDRFLTELKTAASTLVSGDIFMMSYSGHGGQLPDLNGDEDDGQDETWCLYDGELVDDEMYAALQGFKSGVRILAFADSCHSGTSLKQLMMSSFYRLGDKQALFRDAMLGSEASPESAFRAMPIDVAAAVYDKNKGFYDAILSDKSISNSKGSIRASVLFFAACQDNQLSRDGVFNGAFTGHLRAVWNAGKFSGDYESFAEALRSGMPPDQTPAFSVLGPVDKPFQAQKPFSIALA